VLPERNLNYRPTHCRGGSDNLRRVLDDCRRYETEYSNNPTVKKLDGYDKTYIKDYRRELTSLQKNIESLEKKLCI
jgi:hypothetical protein